MIKYLGTKDKEYLKEDNILSDYNVYAESLGISTYNADTNYQSKTTLTFTAESGATYIILASWALGTSNSYNDGCAILYDETNLNILSEQRIRSSTSQEWNPGGTSYYFTASLSAPITFRIKYKTLTTGTSVRIKNATLIAIKITTDDKVISSINRDIYDTDTNYQDKLILTFTPETTGNYLIISTCVFDGHNARVRCLSNTSGPWGIDNDTYSVADIYGELAVKRQSYGAIKNFNLYGSTPAMFKIQYSTSDAEEIVGISYAYIIALKLDGFHNNVWRSFKLRSTNSGSYKDKFLLNNNYYAGYYLQIASYIYDYDCGLAGEYGLFAIREDGSTIKEHVVRSLSTEYIKRSAFRLYKTYFSGIENSSISYKTSAGKAGLAYVTLIELNLEPSSSSSSNSSSSSSSSSSSIFSLTCWETKFNNSYWNENDESNWVTDHWESDNQPGLISIESYGSWKTGYRPTQCRITFNFPEGINAIDMQVQQDIGFSDTIYNPPSGIHSYIINLTDYSQGDITSISAQTWNNVDFTIVNIEFYVC